VAGSCEHGNEPSGPIKGPGIFWLAERLLASHGPCCIVQLNRPFVQQHDTVVRVRKVVRSTILNKDCIRQFAWLQAHEKWKWKRMPGWFIIVPHVSISCWCYGDSYVYHQAICCRLRCMKNNTFPVALKAVWWSRIALACKLVSNQRQWKDKPARPLTSTTSHNQAEELTVTLSWHAWSFDSLGLVGRVLMHYFRNSGIRLGFKIKSNKVFFFL
jgi:hypothetical protein